ncbi:MAG: aldehyde dehydrogenase family protein, partial [Solirubrobacterales bacterium]|nr:aldehyde dehydrogenase family protein [Solirubrobacterales bacterium]
MEAAMLIGGEWRQAAAGEEIEVVNPATEEVVGTVPAGDATDVAMAVENAKRAFPGWAATDVEQRAHILSQAATLIEECAGELAATLTAEQGKPLAEARGEINHLAHGVRYYAEAATKVRGAYQELPSALGPSYGMVIRRP